MHADTGLRAARELSRTSPSVVLGGPLLVVAVIALSLFTGWNVARGSVLLWVPLALVVLALYSTVRTDLLFVGWLAVSPFIQENARETAIGWVLTNVFYVLPVGVLLIRHADQQHTDRQHVEDVGQHPPDRRLSSVFLDER